MDYVAIIILESRVGANGSLVPTTVDDYLGMATKLNRVDKYASST